MVITRGGGPDRWTFAGLLGKHVSVREGWTIDEKTGDMARQIVVKFSVPDLHTPGEGNLTEVETIPDDASERFVAERIVDCLSRLLAHEILESLRWHDRPVYDAHPERAGSEVANGPTRIVAADVHDATALEPWHG